MHVAFPVAIHDMCTLGWLEHRSFVRGLARKPRYGTHRSVPAVFVWWCSYIVDYARWKKAPLDVTGWQWEGPLKSDCPQQGNGVDCGAFVCIFALHAAYDKPLEFSQADMPNARRHIARTVLCGDM